MKHLDSRRIKHHDAYMRTTVTLDKDVERLLRGAMHRTRRGFKETLNSAIRAGLSSKRQKGEAFVVKARGLGLRSGLDPAGFNKLADELEVDAFMARERKRTDR